MLNAPPSSALLALALTVAACAATTPEERRSVVLPTPKAPPRAVPHKIAPRASGDPEPVVLAARDSRGLTLFPQRRRVELIPKTAGEAWLVAGTLFHGAFDVAWLVPATGEPDTIGVVGKGGVVRLGPVTQALVAPGGSWLLADGRDGRALYSLPSGSPAGPVALPWSEDDPVELVTDEYVGGRAVLGIADRKLRVLTKHVIAYGDAAGNIGVASTVDPTRGQERFFVEAWDMTTGKRLHQTRYALDGYVSPSPPRVKISPDKTAYAAATEGEVRRVDMKSGRALVLGTPGGQGTALDLVFSEDGAWVCAQWNDEVSGFRFDPSAKAAALPSDRREVFGIEGERCVRKDIPASPDFFPGKTAVNNGLSGYSGPIATTADGHLFAVLEHTMAARDGRFVPGRYQVSVFQSADGARKGTFALALKRPEPSLGIEFDPRSGHLLVHASWLGGYAELDIDSGKWTVPFDDHRSPLDRLAPEGKAPWLIEAARLGAAKPTDRWTIDRATLRGPDGASIVTPERVYSVREGPTGVVVAVHERSLSLYRTDGQLLADVVPAADGTAVALLKGGAVDLRGDRADAPLRCRDGDVVRAWSTCRDRFLVPGALDRALAGAEDWLE